MEIESVKSPAFVLIAKARRITTYVNSRPIETIFTKNRYCEGEIGLFHPGLIKQFREIFSPQKENETLNGWCSRVFNSGFNQVISRPIYSSSTSGNAPFLASQDEIPILLYDPSTETERLTLPGEPPFRRNPGYIIAPLSREEFEILEGNNPERIIEQANNLSIEKSIMKKEEYELQDCIRNLLVFDGLMKGAYRQLPVEVTMRQPDNKGAKSLEDHYRQLEALDEARRKSLEHAHEHWVY